MTRVRRAGSRWRLKADQVLTKPTADGCTYGTAYEVTSDGRATPSETTTVLPGTELDEVVVGGWLHLEQMDTGLWWANVGGVTVNVRADRDGRPRSVSVYGPGDYAGAVDGCAYELVWSGQAGADSAAARALPSGKTRAAAHTALDNLIDDGDPTVVEQALALLGGYWPRRGPGRVRRVPPPSTLAGQVLAQVPGLADRAGGESRG